MIEDKVVKLEQQERARREEQMKREETDSLQLQFYRDLAGEQACAACGPDAGGALAGVCGPPRRSGPCS